MPSDTPCRELRLPDGERLAYRQLPGASPGVVFLGGFVSDMEGTKARALESHCRARGWAYLRFDYSGHGRSSGRFEDGTLGRWKDDALAVVDGLTEGPLVLVGSSMGAWIALLVARERPERVCGLVTVAAAPDFTADLLPAWLGPAERCALEDTGVVRLPNPHGEGPTPITRGFLAEAGGHLLLRGPIPVRCPVRLVHGEADAEVPWQTSLRVLERLDSRDVELVLVKGGDHRLSDAQGLRCLCEALGEVRRRAATGCGDTQR